MMQDNQNELFNSVEFSVRWASNHNYVVVIGNSDDTIEAQRDLIASYQLAPIMQALFIIGLFRANKSNPLTKEFFMNTASYFKNATRVSIVHNTYINIRDEHNHFWQLEKYNIGKTNWTIAKLQAKHWIKTNK